MQIVLFFYYSSQKLRPFMQGVIKNVKEHSDAITLALHFGATISSLNVL